MMLGLASGPGLGSVAAAGAGRGPPGPSKTSNNNPDMTCLFVRRFISWFLPGCLIGAPGRHYSFRLAAELFSHTSTRGVSQL